MRPTSVFVGGLHEDTQKEDLEKEFSKFGAISKIWVARNPPGFAFIEFEDDEDAQKAIKEMNGAVINGNEVRVDVSRNNRRDGRDGRSRRYNGGRGGYRYGGRGSYNSGRRGRGGSRYGDHRSNYRSRSPVRDRYAGNW